MKTPAEPTWMAANQRALVAQLSRIRGLLERRASEPSAAAVAQAPTEYPSTLELLCATFGLSPFERDVVLLCAGVELESGFAELCARAQGDPARTFPTFSLALAALPEAHWSAASPSGALRRWRLIEVGSGASLTLAPLRIDERVLHHLTGLRCLDERLAGIVRAPAATEELLPSQREVAEEAAAVWESSSTNARLPVIGFCGRDPATLRAAAAAVCARLGLDLHVMAADSVPQDAREQETLARLWEREAALGSSALLVEVDDVGAGRLTVVSSFLEQTAAALLLAGRSRWRLDNRAILSFDVPSATAAEQRRIWQETLALDEGRMDEDLDRLISQFDLPPSRIRAACAEARSGAASYEEMARRVWDAGRRQARPRLDDLAQHLEPRAGWDDLVLPAAQLGTLQEIAVHVEHRARVYEDWGFAAKSARGLGISALFVGPSGTGKTLGAEVLAQTLGLDLYRIDLSQVVSKYIGETEKNLRRVFDAAEEGGAVLFFDEADALFGKRSEVKDSHDRYANIEVSYLLQRMEAYRGLAILATNLKDALDPAFLRRIRFVVHFPFPDAALRAEIWRRIFPAETPTEGLEIEKLARLNIAGGNIRNIALNAAFLAAADGTPVRMTHVARAARGEYAKLERPLTEAELAGWNGRAG